MQPKFNAVLAVPGDDLARLVAAAPSGATIALAPGVYRLRAPLVLDRPLTLAGPATLRAYGGDALVVEAAACLRDLDLVGGGLVVRGELDAVDVRVDGAPGAGVAFEGRATGTLRRALVESCGGPGVRVSGLARPVIDAGIFLANAGAGIEWADDARGEAHGNLLEGNPVGLLVGGRARPHLLLNTFRRNGTAGPVFAT